MRLIQSFFVIVLVSQIAACGNKGALFLHPDIVLAMELEKVSVRMIGTEAEIPDDAVFDEKTQTAIRP